jgi:SAM-dependent methyltransferase
MSRDDVRLNAASWESDSDDYQARNAAQLNRWDRFGWGVWDVPEEEIRALGDVRGLDALELGCGACQSGIKVAMRGARVTGLDVSANQLRAVLANQAETGIHVPLVQASAEEIPFAVASFDLVFCDHGATTFTEPSRTIPEVARVLRPQGRLVFNISTPFIGVCWGEADDEPAGWTLRWPYFGSGRDEHRDPDGSVWVECRHTYGEWIRTFRDAGLVIQNLIELRPPEGAEPSTFSDYATIEWARDFPGEHIWDVRKEG